MSVSYRTCFNSRAALCPEGASANDSPARNFVSRHESTYHTAVESLGQPDAYSCIFLPVADKGGQVSPATFYFILFWFQLGGTKC